MSARKTNRASFGNTRQLASGRWQARYPDAAGRAMNAPSTFATKREALDHLAAVRADRMRGAYIDHRAGLVAFGTYARDWIANGGSRGRLADRTRAEYGDVLDGPLATFHDATLAAVTPSEVRAWYTRTGRALAKSARARGGDGHERLRQAYVLLRAVMATAVRDGLIASNPCTIVGAGSARSKERPYLAPDVLAAIVERMPARYHLPLRVIFGGHLRIGELVGLERRDYRDGALVVERQATTLHGVRTTSPTKTGTARIVALPPTIAAMLDDHLASTTGFPRSPMFEWGGWALTRGALQTAFRKAARAVDAGDFHLHDVRHSGLTVAAQAGATTRELMARAGHRTSAAAMVYQHAAEERGQVLANAMDALAGVPNRGATGTPMARGALQVGDERA